MLDRINKQMARSGAALHWLHAKSKRPIGDGWSKEPVKTLADLERAYRKGNNIGVRLGKPSKTSDGYLHVLDLDIRVSDEADAAWESLAELFPDVDFSKFPRVQSGSGGHSRHIYLVTDEPFPSKKLATSGEKFTDDEGKKHFTWEIEFFGTGKQVAMPPSIHPDTDKPYRWETEYDLTAKPPHVDADLIADLIYGEEDDAIQSDVSTTGVSYREAEEYLESLPDDWFDERELWIKGGMALHHEFDGSDDALDIWREWSKQSTKFNERDLKVQWKSFKDSKSKIVTMRTIIDAAREAAHDRMWQEDGNDLFDDDGEEDEARIREPNADDGCCTHPIPAKIEKEFETIPAEKRPVRLRKQAKHPLLKDIPDRFLTIPGVLGQVVDYFNVLAIRPQPQFGVQSALAIGSIVLARNWKTDRNNFSSLYLINVLESSSGKENIGDVISYILEDAGLDSLIGGGDFTSDSAIDTRLEISPKTISVVDEIGHVLRAVKAQDGVKSTVEKVLLILYSSIHKTYRPKMFSGANKTDDQKKAAADRRILRAALTLVGMTTPSVLMEALGEDDIVSGFLNRLLMVVSPIALQYPMRPTSAPVPRAVRKWCIDYADESSEEDDMEVLKYRGQPTLAPAPKVIPFSDAAHARIEELNIEITDAQQKLQDTGLHPMLGRTMEMAQRVALIVAASCRSKTIEIEHLEWAYGYVRFYHDQTIDMLRNELGRGKFAKIADEVAEYVIAQGAEGASLSMLFKNNRRFDRLDKESEKEEVLARMKSRYGISLQKVDTGKPGRPPERYVAPQARRRKRSED